MSSPIVASLEYATRQVSIYLGVPMLIVGVVGGVCNLIVFLSLRTFRRNSCAFYLTVMSFVNIVILVTSLLSRITISGFGVDWSQSSVLYCKWRAYINQGSILMSLTCICLATIDQYLSTRVSSRLPYGSDMKLTRIITVLFLVVWLLHGTPHLFYYSVRVSPTTGKAACGIASLYFQQYTVYGFLLTLSGVVPLLITIVFGLLAYRNVRQLAHRTVPLVRRELDKQMTTMVLVHIIFDLFTLLPYIVVRIVALDGSLMDDPVTLAFIQFMTIFTVYLYYMYFVVSQRNAIFDYRNRCALPFSAHSISICVCRTVFDGNSFTSFFKVVLIRLCNSRWSPSTK